LHSSISDNKSIFDRLGQGFRFKEVMKHLPVRADLLDCGCGRGEFLKYAENRIKRGYGIDSRPFDPGSRGRFTFIKGNLNGKIEMADGCVDVVTAMAIIEHLDSPDIFLREVKRILRPGGTCIFTTPSPRAKPVLEFLAFKMGIIDPGDIRDHKKYYTREELGKMFGIFPRVKIGYFTLGMNTIVVAGKDA